MMEVERQASVCGDLAEPLKVLACSNSSTRPFRLRCLATVRNKMMIDTLRVKGHYLLVFSTKTKKGGRHM